MGVSPYLPRLSTIPPEWRDVNQFDSAFPPFCLSANRPKIEFQEVPFRGFRGKRGFLA
jgi:hypothetical protein